MKVADVMSATVEAVDAQDSLRTVAARMRALDVGMLPVRRDGAIVGAVTDRDIAVRAIAEGHGCDTRVAEVMTRELVACAQDASVADAVRLMERYRVRRLLVADRQGVCTGVLSMADIARRPEIALLAGSVLEEVSRPCGPAAG